MQPLAAIVMFGDDDDAIAEKVGNLPRQANTGCARYAFAFVSRVPVLD